jgi:hypothetical protein
MLLPRVFAASLLVSVAACGDDGTGPGGGGGASATTGTAAPSSVATAGTSATEASSSSASSVASSTTTASGQGGGIVPCEAGTADCNGEPSDGCEIDTTSDPSHCGGCDEVCGIVPDASPSCVDSTCVPSCFSGSGDCNGEYDDGCEVLLNTITDCGDCGIACPAGGPNAAPVCTPNGCAIACDAGFDDCDSGAAGCETPVDDDPSNCGSCGFDCGADPCDAGACVPLVLASHGLWTPDDLAVDGAHVFYTLEFLNEVRSVPVGGGPSMLVATASLPESIAVDGTSAYWTEPTAIKKVAKTGGAPVTLVSGLNNPYGIALDENNVYFTVDGDVRRVPKEGGAVTVLAQNQGFVVPMKLAIDATHLYWPDFDAMQVMKLPLAGGAPVVLATAPEKVSTVALHGDTAFFSSSDTIYSVPVSGGAPTVLASGFFVLLSIASDGARVYLGQPAELSRLPAAGGVVETLAPIQAWSMVIDGAYLYWVGGGQVLRSSL